MTIVQHLYKYFTMRFLFFLSTALILFSCSKEQQPVPKAIASLEQAPDTLYLMHMGSLYRVLSDGSGAQNIFTGFDAAISSDHTLIAYTEYKKDTRFVAYYDPRSGYRHIYNNLPGDNSYGAQLSPDIGRA